MTDDTTPSVPDSLASLAAAHLIAAQDRLEQAHAAYDTLRGDRERTASELVALAEVHTRIAHASAALAMLEPRPQVAEDAPGLEALERLAAAIERLADAETR